jgi:hypothetical protein
MYKIKIVLICILLLGLDACRSHRGATGNGRGDQEEQGIGKMEPFFRRYYIENKVPDANSDDPELNFDQTMATQFYLSDDISADGTNLTKSQYIDVGVIRVKKNTDLITVLFKKGTKVTIIRIEGRGNIFVMKGNKEGGTIELPFSAGKDGMYFFSPRGGQVMFKGKPIYVTNSPVHLNVVIDRSDDKKAIVMQAEGSSIEEGSSDSNGDSSEGGNGSAPAQQNNQPQQQQQTQPANTQPATPAKKTPSGLGPKTPKHP